MVKLCSNNLLLQGATMNNTNITINNESKFVAIEFEPCDDQTIIRLPKKMKQALIAKAKEKEVSISCHQCRDPKAKH
jgi:hypothetical protein